MAEGRCRSCKRTLEGSSTFCKHCGKKIKYPSVKNVTCPSCRERIDMISTFCKHCGAHLRKFIHTHHLGKLLNFIIFLLIALILIIVFSYPLYQYQPITGESEATITIDTLSCTWEEDHYEVCETISWTGDTKTYAKGYIPGGEILEAVTSHYDAPFVYCQPVGTEDGQRVARAMVFDTQGLIKDIGKAVFCERQTTAQPDEPSQKGDEPSQKGKYTHIIETGFVGQKPLGRSLTSRANGSYEVAFPDVVRSCDFSGTWIVDDDLWSRQVRYCHGAKGRFSGHATSDEQYVINDPQFYHWSGLSKPKIDPPPKRYEGYSLFMNTCGSRYYQGPRYGIKATLSGFNTKTLTFNWDYFDDDTKPHVNFRVIMECELERL